MEMWRDNFGINTTNGRRDVTGCYNFRAYGIAKSVCSGRTTVDRRVCLGVIVAAAGMRWLIIRA